MIEKQEFIVCWIDDIEDEEREIVFSNFKSALVFLKEIDDIGFQVWMKDNHDRQI